MKIANENNWQLICNAARQLPNEDHELMPGVKWGDYSQLYTPAFWKIQYISHMQRAEPKRFYKLGNTILEEIVVCLLGGFGMPSEVGLAAFDRLKKRNLIIPGVSWNELFDALSQPFDLSGGKRVTYRFYNQRTKYLHKLLNKQDLDVIPVHSDLELRKWLLSVDGIGLKTASWITRNWLDSDRVAILDIHILRAGLLAGFYEKEYDLNKYYLDLERQYLSFCEALEVSSGIMDAIIWEFMKKTNRLAISALKHSN